MSLRHRIENWTDASYGPQSSSRDKASLSFFKCFLVGGSRPRDTFAVAEQSASLPPWSERRMGLHKTPLILASTDDHAHGVNRTHGNVAGPVTSNENAIMRVYHWIKLRVDFKEFKCFVNKNRRREKNWNW